MSLSKKERKREREKERKRERERERERPETVPDVLFFFGVVQEGRNENKFHALKKENTLPRFVSKGKVDDKTTRQQGNNNNYSEPSRRWLALFGFPW